jgi:hypothetical protein
MWLVNVTCSDNGWKRSAVEFKAMTHKFQGNCVSSKKMPDGTRIMGYKIEDISDAESFSDECTS